MQTRTGQLAEHLRTVLEEAAKSWPARASRPDQLTVGVEHEFFLRGDDGLANHAQAFRLFTALERRGWPVLRDEDAKPISATMPETTVVLKFEHDPHLLEITCGPHGSLHDLERELGAALSLIDACAEANRLSPLHVPYCDLPVTSESHASGVDRLHAYRRMLAERGLFDLQFLNYTSTIAATQTHVGGLPWLWQDAVVNGLYRYEPAIAMQTSTSPAHAKRISVYKAALASVPLSGIPDFAPVWTLQKWLNTVCESPLASEDARIVGRSFVDEPQLSPAIVLAGARDAQIIKPRLRGTIEFRADGAQPTVAAILRSAALRLGAASQWQHPSANPLTYGEARRRWQLGAAGSPDPADAASLALIRDGLKSRGFGEERFI